MAVLDIVIDILRINCSFVECNYANPMEGLFNLVFFPSVFIMLLIFMLAGFVLGRAGITNNKLMHFLLSIAFFAFIIFQDLYTMFVSLSTVWYFAIIVLIGLWLVIRMFFGPHRGEPHGYMSGRGGGKGVARKLAEAVGIDPDLDVIAKAGNVNELKREIEKIDAEIKVQEGLKDAEPDERSRAGFANKISQLEHAKKAAELRIEDIKGFKKTGAD